MGFINSAKIAWKQDGLTRLEDELDHYERMYQEHESEELQLTIDRLSNLVEKAKEELEELED